MKKKVFYLSVDNAQEVKKVLIEEFGISNEVMNELDYGYYAIVDGNQIIPITMGEFLVEAHKGAIVVGVVGSVTGGVSTAVINSELNTSHYSETNDAGKATGKGYSFEDMANRKAREEGKIVDSSIGKNCQKGGADAIVDGRKVQYKCSIDPKRTADKIEERGGYPDQDIVVNTELVEPLKEILKKREREGRVPKGTSDRVFDSGISAEEAKKVAMPFTRESLLFDAKTALPTLGIVFVGVAGTSLLYDSIDSGKLEVKKALTRGAIWGGLAYIGHIVWNQLLRI